MNELALFSGCGGGILGGKLLGWRTVCAVEINAFCARRLMQRQNEGYLPPFPIWDDVCSFDGRPWRGVVDVVSGGFPCQDISAAGKGAGITGERSGLWKEFARIIGEVGPRYVLVENSPVLTSRGLGVVLGDLAALGYDAKWGVLGAADAIWSLGDPCIDHERARIWIRGESADAAEFAEREPADEADAFANERIARLEFVRGGESDGEAETVRAGADAEGFGHGSRRARRFDSDGAGECEQAFPQDADADGAGCARADLSQSEGRLEEAEPARRMWWSVEPGLDRVAHGVADWMERGTAIGNGQSPAVVDLAWETLGGLNF